MKKSVLTVAQIGCGAFAASQDLPNFKKNTHTRLKWCCDASLERARNMAKRFGVPKTTANFMDAINDPETDLIKIATSHEIHLPIIEAAAAQGKHVFCEKPLALLDEHALKIIGAVRRNRIKLCVDLNRRMSPAMQKLREHWRAHCRKPRHQPWRYRELKRKPFPEELQSQFLVRVQDESSSYRLTHLDPLKGGGLIIGETVHWLDLACWFFEPAFPMEIQAFGSRRFSHVVNLRFSNGNTAVIVFNCGGTFDYPKELIEVTAQAALFRCLHFVENEYHGIPGLSRETFPLQNDPFPSTGKCGGLQGFLEKYYRRVRHSSNAKLAGKALSPDKGHQSMLDAFVRAVIEGEPSPCDEMAGYRATMLANLAINSIELRQALPVPLDKLNPCIV